MDKMSMDETPFTSGEKFIDTNLDKLVFYDFTVVPVVYTTRLDEMCVFNRNMDSLDVEQLTKCIERESCPNKIALKSTNHINKTNAESFIKLKNQIGQFNSKVKKVVHEKNRKLLRMCKPMSVVLEDLKYLRQQGTQIPIKQQHLENSCDEEVLPLSYIKPKSIVADNKSHTITNSQVSNYREPGLHLSIASSKSELEFCNKTNSTHITFQHDGKQSTFAILEKQKIERYMRENLILRKYVKGVSFSGYQQTIILIENWRSKVTEICCVNRYGNVTQYYKTSNINVKKLCDISSDFEENVKISHCCWYQREECRKLLFMNTTLGYLLKKPHDCKPGECTCCCRIDNQPTGGSDTRNNVSNIDNINVTHDSQSNTASNQMKKVNQNLEMDKIGNLNLRIPESTDEWLRDLLNRKTSAPQTYGLISRAMTYKPMVHLKKTNEILKKDGCLRFAKIIIRKQDQALQASDLNCSTDCYYVGSDGDLEIFYRPPQPERLIDALISPTILQQTPKKNEFDKTICCWYKREILTLGLRVKKMLPTAIKFIRTPHMCPVGECKCCCKPVINQKIILEDIDLPRVQTHTNDHVSKSRQLKMEINKGQIYASSISTKNTAQESKKVKMLISIIEKFGDTRLVVDAKGNLAAELKTPVSLLSAPELKCLSSIISLAQKQITSLGLTPGKHFNLEINTSGQPSIVKDKETGKNTNDSVSKRHMKNNSRNKNTKMDKSHTINCKLSKKSIIKSSLSNILSEKSKHSLDVFESYFKKREINTYKSDAPSTSVTPKILNTFTVGNGSNFTEKACSTDPIMKVRTGTSWEMEFLKSQMEKRKNLKGVKRKSSSSERNTSSKNRRTTSTKIHHPSNNQLSVPSAEILQNKINLAPMNSNNANLQPLSQLADHVPALVKQTVTQPFTLSNDGNVQILRPELQRKHYVNILRKSTKAQPTVNVVDGLNTVQIPSIDCTTKMSDNVPVPYLAQNDQKQHTDSGNLNDVILPSAPSSQPRENSILLKLIQSSHVPPQIRLTNLNNPITNIQTQNILPKNYVVNPCVLNEIPKNNGMAPIAPLPINVTEPNVNLEASINLIGSSMDEDCILGV